MYRQAIRSDVYRFWNAGRQAVARSTLSVRARTTKYTIFGVDHDENCKAWNGERNAGGRVRMGTDPDQFHLWEAGHTSMFCSACAPVSNQTRPALTSWLKVVTAGGLRKNWSCRPRRNSQKSYKTKTMDDAVAYDVTCFR